MLDYGDLAGAEEQGGYYYAAERVCRRATGLFMEAQTLVFCLQPSYFVGSFPVLQVYRDVWGKFKG